IEYRAPDAACNPYLVFAGILAAGLAGIEAGDQLPPPLEQDVRELSPADLESRGIVALPASLNEAIRAFERSDLMRQTLGDHIVDSLVKNKRHEWAEYRAQVSQFELDRYFGTL
ncbi:MAG TPA: glutamine synthetase, partial [Dehalococcoidia bacterium]|nr:glutamine synthetase [Dehalococcoidia bacterium]